MKGILLTEAEYKSLISRINGVSIFCNHDLIWLCILDKMRKPIDLNLRDIWERMRIKG